jgi:hypothetical protein
MPFHPPPGPLGPTPRKRARSNLKFIHAQASYPVRNIWIDNAPVFRVFQSLAQAVQNLFESSNKTCPAMNVS